MSTYYRDIMKIKNIFVIFAASLAVMSVTGQERLALDDYRQRVIEYSRSLKISKENFAAAMARVDLARTSFLPNLAADASVNYQTNDPSGFGLKTTGYGANLDLQQIVYAGGAIRNQYNATKIQSDIASMNEALALDNVVYGADMAYWMASAHFEIYNTQKEFVEIVRSLYQVVNERYSDGYVSRTDLLMVETRLKEAELQLINANKTYNISLQNLNILIGNTDINQSYEIVDTIRTAIPEPMILGLNEALERRPDYQISMRNVDLSEQNVKLSSSAYNPQFVVGFKGVFGTPMLNFTGLPGLYGVAYGSLKVPIFHFGERQKSVAVSKAGLRASEYQMQGVADQVNVELNNSITSIAECRKQVDAAESNLDLANANLELNTFSYNEGRLPILDVLSSQMTWLQAYVSVINANFSYKSAIAEYNRALGGLSPKK